MRSPKLTGMPQFERHAYWLLAFLFRFQGADIPTVPGSITRGKNLVGDAGSTALPGKWQLGDITCLSFTRASCRAYFLEKCLLPYFDAPDGTDVTGESPSIGTGVCG